MIVKAVVTLPHVSGLPEDSAQNTFCFGHAAAQPTAQNFGSLSLALNTFYNSTNAPAAWPIAGFLSPALKRAPATGGTVKLYDITNTLGGTPHGSPVFEDVHNLDVAPGIIEARAEELAVVLTLRALLWAAQPVERPDGADEGAEVDRPRQRFSGRLFFGPVANTAEAIGGNRVRTSSGVRDALMYGARQLRLQASQGGWSWNVWSRKDAAVRVITHVQADDAFDVQRRRGPEASLRQELLVTPA